MIVFLIERQLSNALITSENVILPAERRAIASCAIALLLIEEKPIEDFDDAAAKDDEDDDDEEPQESNK